MPDFWVDHLWANICKVVHSFISKMLARLLLQSAMAAEEKKMRQSLAFMHIQKRSPCSLSVSCTCALEEAQRGGTASRESEWYYWEGYFYSLPESAESTVNNKHHRRVMTAEDLSPTVRCCTVWVPVRALLFWLCSQKKFPLFHACVADWSYCLPWLPAPLEKSKSWIGDFPPLESSHEGNQSHSQLKTAVPQGLIWLLAFIAFQVGNNMEMEMVEGKTAQQLLDLTT